MEIMASIGWRRAELTAADAHHPVAIRWRNFIALLQQSKIGYSTWNVTVADQKY
jgi:hypothetical protein